MAENRVRRLVRKRLVENTPDPDAIMLIAADIRDGISGVEVAEEHPSAGVLARRLAFGYHLSDEEAQSYMNSIEDALTAAGADRYEAGEFVATLANL